MSIVLSKIQADTSKLVRETPPEVPEKSRELPSVTGIEAVISGHLAIAKHQIYAFRSRSGCRNLYHAQVPTKEEICIKFTQRYSRDSHDFCADYGLAWNCLGSNGYSGGWFALAMAKVDIADLWTVESFPELGNWKAGRSGWLSGLIHRGRGRNGCSREV